jgi:hypothetical protein
MLGRLCCEHSACLVDQDGSCAASSNVDAEGCSLEFFESEPIDVAVPASLNLPGRVKTNPTFAPIQRPLTRLELRSKIRKCLAVDAEAEQTNRILCDQNTQIRASSHLRRPASILFLPFLCRRLRRRL